MRYSLAASALVLAATSVYGQTTSVYGQTTSTSGEACESTYPTSFEITIVPVSDTAAVARRGLGSNNAVKHLSNMGKRQTAAACMSSGTLVADLNEGVLTDSQGRTGSIVANRQFQFDPEGGQAGAIFTSGFAVCPDGTLSLNGQKEFYQCASGEFFNLYDEAIAEQCSPVYIEIIPCDGSSTGSTSARATGSSTGTQIADGQINSGINQIADGQLQVPSIQQIADGQLQNSGVSQIADGQIQGRDASILNVEQADTTAKAKRVKRQESYRTEEAGSIENDVAGAAVPRSAQGAFAGLVAAAAGYAAMI